MATSCLCDICNCGRHRCVEERTSIYQKVNASTDMPTEYNSKYPIYESYQPRASTKPESLHVMQGRLDTVPTSQDHYRGTTCSKREPILPVDTYHLRTNKFEGRTAYQEQFEAQPSARRESLKPKTTYVMKGRLDTVPTSKDHFPAWGSSKRKPIMPLDNYHLVTHKFGGTSAYQDQFQAHPRSTRESLKPKTTYVMKGRLDTVPTSKDHFPAWEQCTREPIMPLDNYHLVTHKFGGTSAYQDQFQAHPRSTRESLKPKTTYVMKGRLDTVPTSKDHFPAWEQCTREPIMPLDNYHLVTHKFGGTSAYQDQFQAHPRSTRESLKPKTTYVMKGRLDTVPTSKDHFPAWEQCTREPIMPLDNYHLVTHKFGGTSAYQDQFQAQPPATRESIKPFDNLHLSRAAFSGENKQAAMSTYGTMFAPKQINVCPASFSSPPGFVFKEYDDRGHRCFKQVEE